MAVNSTTGQDERSHGPGLPPAGITLKPALIRQRDPHAMRKLLQTRLSVAGFPPAEFIGSPNYYPGRAGTAIDLFVQHTSVDSMAQCIATFQSPASQVSATWALEAPRLVQFVPINGGSYANGNWDYNMRSLTLERIDNGDFNADVTGAMRNLLIVIYAHIHIDWGIPLQHSQPAGFLPHREVPGASTGCPDGINIDTLLSDTQQYIATGGSEMWTLEQVKALVIVTYVAAGNRTPATQGDIDYWADQITKAPSIDQGFSILVNQPEFLGHRAEVSNVLAALIPDHNTHAVVLPRGPAGPPGKEGAAGPPGTTVAPGTTLKVQ
jgi:N-acetylmuramoyl-L-alanine amidase